MPAPTPIHRDPDSDGNDYGCVGPRALRANDEVARLVIDARARLAAGEFVSGEDLIAFVRSHLERIRDLYRSGSCDTVVKENVFAALQQAIEDSKLDDFDEMEIYGW